MALSLKRFRFKRLSDLLLVGFITSIGIALLNPVWSLYFYDIFKSTFLVGAFSSLLSVVALICFFLFTPIIQRFQGKKVYLFALIASIFVLLGLSIFKGFYIGVILIVLYVMLMTLRGESFGILFRDEVKDKSIGKSEGLSYTLSSLGWLIGALFVIPLLGYYKFPSIFFFSALFTFLALITFCFYKGRHKNLDGEVNLIKDIKDFFRNKSFLKIYIVSIGDSIWRGLIFVYVPLYIIMNNLDRSYVGIFLFLFIVPYLIEYYVGKKSDRIGNKFFISLGYIVISILALLAFIFNDFKISLIFLALSSFGTCFIQPTRETYFFKLTSKKEEEKYYGIFLTHIEIGLLIGKIIPAVLLLYFSFRSIFLVFSIIMFLFYLYSLRLEDV